MERKLTAILCADVYGYSRLMGEDEEATLRTLSSYRHIIDHLIESHRGRFVNSAGDSVLAEFTSVVEAVNCAVAIQEALKLENGNLPPDRRMEFRIGINLGDVMVEGEQIYGDGVNIAARLESLAEPGSICISGVVHDQVKSRLALNYRDLGVQQVKNIAEPVRVWRVVANGVALQRAHTGRIAGARWHAGLLSGAGLAIIVLTFVLVQHLSLRPQPSHPSIPTPPKPALSLPSVPSIAVLPFANLSGDPQQEYFSDGITDDLISDLSRIPKLFVIARTSSFTYKSKLQKVQTIGRELGVKYLLEGSARRAGDQVRINVQLVEAASGNEVWSQRFDRQMRDIFKLQDEIVQGLSATVGLQLPILEKGIVIPQRTSNIQAYDYYLRGLEVGLTFTPVGFAKAQIMLEKAIEIDPAYADAYAWLGSLHWLSFIFQWNTNADARQRATDLANQAISFDDTNALAYMVRGWVAAVEGKTQQAIADSEHAILLDPNSAVGWSARAAVNTFIGGNPTQTLAYVQKARRLDPQHPEIGCLQAGLAYEEIGRNREALNVLETCEPNNPYSHLFLIWAYSSLGRQDQARAEAAEVLRASPGFSLKQMRERMRGNDWQDPAAQKFVSALRQAGLK